jgi:ribosomal protein S18 acetylase RimI-like enzyme
LRKVLISGDLADVDAAGGRDGPAVRVRRATEHDEPAIRALWEAFEAEIPEPDGFDPETWDEGWTALRADMVDGAVFLADDDGTVGLLDASAPSPGRWHIETVYVQPAARRRGVARALVRACVAAASDRGVRHVSLEVLSENTTAQTVWRRMGFEPVELLLCQPLDTLLERLALDASGSESPGGTPL